MSSAARTARSYESLAEGDLVRFAQAGERGAFAAIMQRYNQRLFRAARSVMRDEGEAEDVLQEAYTRAFAAFAGFRGDASLATWLTAIVINEARGRLRRRKTMVGLEAVEAAQQDSGQVIMFPSSFGTGSPEADAARAEARRLLEHAVDELPESFRLVFIMREIDGLSVEETAQALDL
ncbi:MAG: sigma-70 family RNA polymerase sigma factor, partial [Proteobacteria bacterium]|nr:sigma-70 family RNA polymerase sigma factor [Pseudomonadota bacterium]